MRTMPRRHAASAVVGCVLVVAALAGCSTASTGTPAGVTSTGGALAGADETAISSWQDPRPATWVQEFPLFAPPSPGDGSLARVQNAGSITVCAQTDIKPLVYLPVGASDPVGYEVDLLTAATKVLGIGSVKYLNVPFASYIPALQAHKCDLLMGGLSPRSDRAAAPGIMFTRPYDHFTNIVVVGSGSGITDISDLAGSTIAAVSNSLQEADAKALGEKVGGTKLLSLRDGPSVDTAVANGTASAGIVSATDLTDNPIADKLTRLDYQVPSDPPSEYADEYDVNPYFWGTQAAVTAEADADLNIAFSLAFAELVDNGTAETIYQEWNVYQTGVYDVIRPEALSPTPTPTS